MFITAQMILGVVIFGIGSATAFAMTAVGYSRMAEARGAGAPTPAAPLAWFVAGVWGLFVMGLGAAIVVGFAGIELLDGVRAGGGGD